MTKLGGRPQRQSREDWGHPPLGGRIQSRGMKVRAEGVRTSESCSDPLHHKRPADNGPERHLGRRVVRRARVQYSPKLPQVLEHGLRGVWARRRLLNTHGMSDLAEWPTVWSVLRRTLHLRAKIKMPICLMV